MRRIAAERASTGGSSLTSSKTFGPVSCSRPDAVDAVGLNSTVVQDFQRLLANAQGGDDTSLEQILLAVEQRLRRYAQVRIGAKLRAAIRDSDILQNAYVEIVKSLPEFAGDEEDFVAWVTAIIENDIRRQNRYFGAAKRQQPPTSQRNALARVLLSPPRTPSAELSSVEEQARLTTALGNLPEDYARVIDLAVFHEKSHREIAAEMGRTESATRMLLSRARTALSLELERLEREGS